MSPIFTPIIIAIFVGIIIFLIGLVFRKKFLLFIGSPAVLLLGMWSILASVPPDPNSEFDRIFDTSNRSTASDIDTIKPTFMDGHFIFFKMPKSEFDIRIRPHFSKVTFKEIHLLREQKLPKGWPQSVSDARSGLLKITDDERILLFYDEKTSTVFASVQYDQW